MEMSPPGAILETALYCEDLDAAQAFYGGFLGLEQVASVKDRHVFFRCGQGMLLVFNPHATVHASTDPTLPVPTHGARGPGHVAFAAEGEALDRWRARLEAAGVEIEADFRWPNGARSVYCRDPEGNSVEFAEPRLWGPTREEAEPEARTLDGSFSEREREVPKSRFGIALET